ncbi:hypothetical protein BN182_3590020 [Clostridioides difficile E9]|nr:hypothetical protein BN182_3590020 [Clostridioides difficile E9]
MDQERLEPQPQQLPKSHRFQGGLQRVDHRSGYIRGALHDPGCVGNHALGHIKYRHDDIECVGENKDGAGSFENPLKK